VDIIKKPIHPIAFAVFPILTLLANNIREVDARVAIRPTFLSIGVVILLLVLITTLIRSSQKAALLASLFIILFFSYGHIYQTVKNAEIFNFVIGRHRYLVPLYLVVLLSGILFIIKKINESGEITRVVNLVSIGLLIYPTVVLVNFSIRTQSGLRNVSEVESIGQTLQIPESGTLPDIYYIVLDTYTRADALQKRFDFDNSPFLNELRELGLYVADCSRSNYAYTLGSLTASLNMDYLPHMEETLRIIGLESDDLWILMKQSLVRAQLEGIGYTTVSFETGYEWSSIKDADIYLAMHENPINLQRILTPFESMLFDSTAAILFPQGKTQFIAMLGGIGDDESQNNGSVHRAYIEDQLFILDQLPGVSSIPEPTFTFAHLLIPHVPFVFDANGDIWSDPGFYSGEKDEPIDEWHWQVGYTSEVQFINNRMLEIISTILENSETDPIIIIHGDHGFRDDNRLLIFNAYYLSDEAATKLYPLISPVNSFRLVFDSYFGTSFGLLPDVSYSLGETNPSPEISPECLTN
jgi:hypothetical protein